MNNVPRMIESLERRVFLSIVPFSGAVTVPGHTDDYSDSFLSVKVTPDGKIVAVGETVADPHALSQWAVFEFNADGSLNTGFGTDGEAANPFAGDASSASTVKIVNDPSDSGYTILVGGSDTVINSRSPKKDDENFAVARYTSGGQLDTSFNGTGSVARDTGSLSDNLDSLMVNSDQTILLAGTTKVRSSNEVAVVKLNADGTPYENSESPFGENGVDIYSFDRKAAGAELVAVPVGAGPANSFYVLGLGTDNYVARIQESGALDPTFGSTVKAGNRNGFTKLLRLAGGTNSVIGIDASDASGLEIALTGTSAVGVSRIGIDKLTNIGTPDATIGRKNGQLLERLHYPAKAAPHGAVFLDDNTIFTFGYTYLLTQHQKATDLVYEQYAIADGAIAVDPSFNSNAAIIESVVGNTRFNAMAQEPGAGLNGGDAFVFAGTLDVPASKGVGAHHILALYRIYANGQTDLTFVG